MPSVYLICSAIYVACSIVAALLIGLNRILQITIKTFYYAILLLILINTLNTFKYKTMWDVRIFDSLICLSAELSRLGYTYSRQNSTGGVEYFFESSFLYNYIRFHIQKYVFIQEKPYLNFRDLYKQNGITQFF